MRRDISSSSEAPEREAACSTSSRRLFRAIAMRSSISAIVGEPGGTRRRCRGVSMLTVVFALVATAAFVLRATKAFLATVRLLRVTTAIFSAACCLRVFDAFLGAALGFLVFRAFAVDFLEADFDAAMFSP